MKILMLDTRRFVNPSDPYNRDKDFIFIKNVAYNLKPEFATALINAGVARRQRDAVQSRPADKPFKGGGNEMELERTVEEAKVLEDGLHRGVVKEIVTRSDPFEYIDFVIQPDGADFEIRYGVPDRLTPNTKLGRLLENFGAKLEIGNKIKIKDFIKIGMRVQFQTLRRKSKKNPDLVFAEIVEDSLKPEEAQK